MLVDLGLLRADHHEAWALRALARCLAGAPREALVLADSVLAVDNTGDVAALVAGQAHLTLGHADLARQSLEEAIKRVGPN